MPRSMQTTTNRWLRGCVSSFNKRSLCPGEVIEFGNHGEVFAFGNPASIFTFRSQNVNEIESSDFWKLSSCSFREIPLTLYLGRCQKRDLQEVLTSPLKSFKVAPTLAASSCLTVTTKDQILQKFALIFTLAAPNSFFCKTIYSFHKTGHKQYSKQIITYF